MLTQRISKAFAERKSFTAQPIVNKMILDFKTQNPTPNFFDSLTLLNLVHKSTLNDSLTKTIQNDVFQAHKVLKAYLDNNASVSEQISKDQNFFKILVFLCDNTFKDFFTAKQYSGFFNTLHDPKTTTKDLLNFFTKKLIFINKNSYTNRTKAIAMDILRSIIVYQMDKQVFDEVPEKLKANNYLMYEEFENSLYSICNMFNHVLQNSKDHPQKYVSSLNEFLEQMSNFSYMTQFTPKLCPLLIEITYQMIEIEKNYTRFAELILNCNEIICKNMDKFSTERFTRIFFMITRIQLANINFTAYELFISTALEYLKKNIKNFTDEQLKSNFYAIGYHSLLTPEIQAMFDRVIDIENIKQKADSDKFINYVRNLLTSSMNIYALEKGPKLNDILSFLLNDLKAHIPGSKHFDLASMLKIAMILRRAEFNEEFYWKEIFKMISDCTREIGEFKFELLYIFNTFEIFRDVPEYSGVLKLVDKFKKDHAHLYKEIINHDVKTTTEPANQFSMLNYQVDIFLKGYVPNFEKEALINNLFYVDFLIPDMKVIFELQGPTHYLKPGYRKYNLLTNFKTKCLEKLGYKVVSIPFNTVLQSEISFDRYLVDRLDEIGQKKKN